MADQDATNQTGMTPRRLESLADAIFAFAMTLLVLSINTPEPGSLESVGSFLSSQSQNFINFFMSFMLLALFWISYSQQFHHIKRTDQGLLYMSLFMLMFVVMVPFTTSLMNDNAGSVTAEVVFSLNLFILSTLLTLNWAYVDRRDMLDREHVTARMAGGTRRRLLMPLVPLAAIVLAFIVPDWSTLVYLLIPVLLHAPVRKKPPVTEVAG